MNEIIKITEKEGKRVVSARDLHEFLESKQEFANWIKNRIDKYDLVKNVDYATFDNFIKREGTNLGSKTTEYALTVDAAKELSMVEGNEKGKQARRYFIECEKVALGNKPIASISDTLLFADAVARSLSMNESSRLLMYQKAAKEYGIPVDMLPAYTQSVDQLLSGTELLKRNGSEWSIRAFNAVMMDKEMLEEKERPSKSGAKKFKSLIGEGLDFGENQVCPNNPRETQPLYYTDKFDELLTILKR